MRITSSYISLENIRFHANHGVLEQERATGGDFTVSVKADCAIAEAVKSDNVDDTLNYATIYEIINKEMQKPSCLLENVAGRIGESILAMSPKVRSVYVKVAKTNPPMGGLMDSVSVELTLER